MVAAWELTERTLEVSRRVRGEDHPDTLACAFNAALDEQTAEGDTGGQQRWNGARCVPARAWCDHPDTVDAIRGKRADATSNHTHIRRVHVGITMRRSRPNRRVTGTTPTRKVISTNASVFCGPGVKMDHFLKEGQERRMTFGNAAVEVAATRAAAAMSLLGRYPLGDTVLDSALRRALCRL